MSQIVEVHEEHDEHHHHTDTAAHGRGDNSKLFVHVFRDDFGSKVGMWLFLFTEILLFGGLFFAYFKYRVAYPHEFHDAALELDLFMGTFNTLILLTSSLTMVLAIAAVQKNRKGWSLFWIFWTVACAFGFLINKYFEWSYKISHGIYPGSDHLAEMHKGETVFFGLYYLMTGLHTLHVIIGAIILAFCFVYVITGTINKDKYVVLENSGLYWHLVDLIWIFLFPLFYLLH